MQFPHLDCCDISKGLKVVIKVSSNCNFRCSYCSNNRHLKSRDFYLDAAKGKAIVSRLLEWNMPYLSICFHGGEPLLSFEVIKDIVIYLSKISKNSNTRLKLSLQSNISLITDEMALFFRTNEVSVGFSLDGPKKINDIGRKNEEGKGGYVSTIIGLNILKKYQRGIGCVCVVHRHNYKAMDQVYGHFMENGLAAFALNRLSGLGMGARQKSYLGISDEQYLYSLKNCYELMVNNNLKIQVLPIVNWIRNILIPSSQGHGCFPCSAGWKHLSLDWNGNVYPCDRFSGDLVFFAGNILDMDVLDVFNSSPMKSCRLRAKEIPQCIACPEIDICGGGCAATAYYEKGSLNYSGSDCVAICSFLQWVRKRLVNNCDERALYVSHLF